MKPPRSADPGVPPPQVLPEKAAVRGLDGSSKTTVAVPAQRPQLDAGRRRVALMPQLDGLTGRPGHSEEALALRLSIIDGGDRMVYTDLRDRKGWAQPLAIDQALRDAGRPLDAMATQPVSPPRVVWATESLPLGARGVPVSASLNPYQAGKSAARGGAAGGSALLKPGTSAGMSATVAHSAPGRSR